MKEKIESLALEELMKGSFMEDLDLPEINLDPDNLPIQYLDVPINQEEITINMEDVDFVEELDLPEMKLNSEELDIEYVDAEDLLELNKVEDLDFPEQNLDPSNVQIDYLCIPEELEEFNPNKGEFVYLKIGTEEDFRQDGSKQMNYARDIKINNWREENSMLYQLDKQRNDYEQICNFTFQPIEVLNYLSILGEENGQFLKIKVTILGEEKKALIIPMSQNKRIAKIIKTEYPEAYIEEGVKDSTFEKIIAQKYAAVMNCIPKVDILNFSGWFQKQGEYIYVHEGLPNCACDKKLPEITGDYSTILKNALYSMNLINEKEKMIPLFLFAHVGYMYMLFELADFKPVHALYVFGNTNCRKTSLFKVLFNIFTKKKDNQSISFSSTKTAMEMFAQKTMDDTLVIDDLSLTNGLDEKELLNKFEYIIRLCGDGMVKRRANKSLDNMIKFHFRSAVAMNGEDLPDLSQSSLLRLFIIEFNKDTVNNEVLSIFQQNPEYMQQYFTLFIHWLEKNFISCCNFIKQNKFDIMKNLNGYFKYPRTKKLAAMLILINLILKESFFPYYGMNYIYTNSEEFIIKAVKFSEAFANEADPYEIYLKVLFNLVGGGELAIADSLEDYTEHVNERSIPLYVGFIKEQGGEEFYCLNPHRCFDEVNKYYKKIKKNFNVSIKKVHSDLDKKGFINKYEGGSRNGYMRKVTMPDKSRSTFLFLDKLKVDEFLNNH